VHLTFQLSKQIEHGEDGVDDTREQVQEQQGLLEEGGRGLMDILAQAPYLALV